MEVEAKMGLVCSKNMDSSRDYYGVIVGWVKCQMLVKIKGHIGRHEI